jgi:hypothetical protein
MVSLTEKTTIRLPAAEVMDKARALLLSCGSSGGGEGRS